MSRNRYNDFVGSLRILLALLAVSAGSLVHAAPAIFPLKDVRAGQRGIGRTVFNGSRVEEFQVEILGVLENLGPRESIILARLKGGPLESTGVMQGMSGSPVYIGGKLVGAVAMGFPLSKEAIAGIRPIDVPWFVIAQFVGGFAATLLFRWLVPSLGLRAKEVVVARDPAPK